jgi:repressor LexA
LMYLICSMLTKKQKNLLLFINKKLRSTGVSPSYEEMKESLNLKSKSGIHRLISALEERGFIKRLAHKARALEVIKLPETASANDIYNSFSPSIIKGGLDEENLNKSNDTEIPVLGKIAAGTPVEAIQNEVSRIPLPANIEKDGEFFGLKVQGDSMIEAGINDGDTVIVKKADTADNGKIVVALIDDHEAMLKRIRRKGKTVALESANRNYETKIFGPDRVKVQGILVSLYRNFQ